MWGSSIRRGQISHRHVCPAQPLPGDQCPLLCDNGCPVSQRRDAGCWHQPGHSGGLSSGQAALWLSPQGPKFGLHSPGPGSSRGQIHTRFHLGAPGPGKGTGAVDTQAHRRPWNPGYLRYLGGLGSKTEPRKGRGIQKKPWASPPQLGALCATAAPGHGQGASALTTAALHPVVAGSYGFPQSGAAALPIPSRRQRLRVRSLPRPSPRSLQSPPATRPSCHSGKEQEGRRHSHCHLGYTEPTHLTSRA